MEIKVEIPLGTKAVRKIVKVDRDAFDKELHAFIDTLENREILDQDLYKKLLEYGINKVEFDQMIEKIKVFASYDDVNTDIGFPYEQWIGRLLEKYE
jgi:hypothetical protein